MQAMSRDHQPVPFSLREFHKTSVLDGKIFGLLLEVSPAKFYDRTTAYTRKPPTAQDE